MPSFDMTDDLDIPEFLNLSPADRERGWAGHTPKPSTPFMVPKEVDAATIELLNQQENERKLRARNRIAKMLIKKNGGSGYVKNPRTGRLEWKHVPIPTKLKPLDQEDKQVIEIAPRTYAEESSAVRSAERLLGKNADFTVERLPDGRFTFTTGNNCNMKMPTKTAAGAPGVARQFTIDPARVYSVRSNARRDARKAGLDPVKAVIAAVDGAGFKIVTGASLKAEKPAKAAKPAKVAKGKPAKAPKAAKAAKPKAEGKTRQRAPGAAEAPREGSRKAGLLDLLKRPEGVSLAEVEATYRWLPHTTRAAISTTARKLGLTIAKSVEEGRGSVYRAT